MNAPAGRIPVSAAAQFGRVAVFLGGASNEREVSLTSGNAVLAALRERGVDAHAWDPAQHDWRAFLDARFDRVFIALHGAAGEDGTVQGALDWIGMPYTGSGVAASATAMDKVISKHLFHAAGIPTPDYRVFADVAAAREALAAFGLPLVIKPAREGSSVGMSIVRDAGKLVEAAEHALSFGGIALAERYIAGAEITVSVLQDEALPSIRIETPRDFYDYRAKYESDRTRYTCPGTDNEAVEARCAELALRVFRELGARGWGRVDFMLGADGEPQVLELNTVPGMTSHSLVPMAAKQAGISFDELCWRILETSVATVTQADEVAVNGA